MPDRVLRAIDAPTIDHRGPGFAAMGRELLAGLGRILRTAGPVVVYPSSGTGAWEAALVNTLSPGDRVLAFETGHFATLWRDMAQRLGLDVEWVPGDWRHGVDPDAVADILGRDDVDPRGDGRPQRDLDRRHEPRARGSRRDWRDHEALLLVDTISSLGSIDYRHDEWGVDVTVGCSQKGLMLPPGLGFNAVSEKALAAPAPVSRAPTGTGSAVIEANQRRRLAVHAADEPLLRPARGDRDAPEERASRTCSRATRRHAEATRARRARLGPRGAVRWTPASTRRR